MKLVVAIAAGANGETKRIHRGPQADINSIFHSSFKCLSQSYHISGRGTIKLVSVNVPMEGTREFPQCDGKSTECVKNQKVLYPVQRWLYNLSRLLSF